MSRYVKLSVKKNASGFRFKSSKTIFTCPPLCVCMCASVCARVSRDHPCFCPNELLVENGPCWQQCDCAVIKHRVNNTVKATGATTVMMTSEQTEGCKTTFFPSNQRMFAFLVNEFNFHNSLFWSGFCF